MLTIIARSVLKMVNFICKFIQIGVCMNYKKATVQKTDILEGIDIKHAQQECILCHYWCYKDVGFKF